MKVLYLFLLLLISTAVNAIDCTPTSHRTTGTHYKPVTEQKKDISNSIIVRGQILAMPDCKPLSNAKVAHWQAGENGRYQDQLRAYLYTDANGRYEFKTEWPNLSPPHIHFIINARGYDQLETQWRGSERKKVIKFDMVLQN